MAIEQRTRQRAGGDAGSDRQEDGDAGKCRRSESLQNEEDERQLHHLRRGARQDYAARKPWESRDPKEFGVG
ncbi:MAG: hypothetical protein M3Z13_04465 [Candidatus Dormibacteraeota bacterium]|nr:hypothetical protein [Candidatus Dormibacteraeota bacterium]